MIYRMKQNADVLKSAKSNITEDEAEAQIRGMAKELGVSVSNLRKYGGAFCYFYIVQSDE